jgi:glutathione S-transferase
LLTIRVAGFFETLSRMDKVIPVHFELLHHPGCPHSRFIRLALHEYHFSVDLVIERVWERRNDFLILNPAGTLPVLLVDGQPPIPDASIIAEYLVESLGDDIRATRLLPHNPIERIEVRRQMSWFNEKFFVEVSRPLTEERYRRLMPINFGGDASPDYQVIRKAREGVRNYLEYIDRSVHQSGWLAGDRISYADLAAAAHLSVTGGISEVMWAELPAARTWYGRLQARPSVRALGTVNWST